MTWKYKYDEEVDKTKIYYGENEIGTIEGKITKWHNGLPKGDAKRIINNAVGDDKLIDLLYGFVEISDEDET